MFNLKFKERFEIPANALSKLNVEINRHSSGDLPRPILYNFADSRELERAEEEFGRGGFKNILFDVVKVENGNILETENDFCNTRHPKLKIHCSSFQVSKDTEAKLTIHRGNAQSIDKNYVKNLETLFILEFKMS